MTKFIAFVVLISAMISYAQTTVSGIVTDDKKEPLPFVNVYFKNSKIGTITDLDGKFSINTSQNFKTLIFSSVGFKSLTYTLKSNKDLNLIIQLEEGETLEEVVVVSKPKKRLKKKENPA